MEYQLIWAGRLWTIPCPPDFQGDTKACATYAQAFAVSGGNHTNAMIQTLTMKYPGLGYGEPRLVPVSVSKVGVVDDVSVSDTSSRASSHNCSQRPTPRASLPVAKGAASDTSGRHKPPPPRATSTALPPRGPPREGQVKKPTPSSTKHTGGWMGSNSTSGKAS